MHVKLTDTNFAEEVEKATQPVLVDFWAGWCGPCIMQGPIIDEVAKEFVGKVKVGKLEVDENPQIAQRFGIMSIPTLAIFKDGKVAHTMVGLQSKDALKAMLKKFSN
ncbi:MAG TPA: thioredoxin [Candidatus Acidoferrales bacterium]|nr:thioredoxin [Candidatus Acidoferrales bacterium]